MEKTTVYLPSDLKKRLAKLAKELRLSEATLIRQGIERVVGEASRPRPRLPLFSSGGARLAERVDEELAKGFGRD